MKNCYGSMAVLVALGFYTVAADAVEQYQTEMSIRSNRTDFGQDSKSITDNVSAEVFFAPVITNGHPYAEAAFLERVGSVNFAVTNGNVKSGTSEGSGPTYSVDFNYTTPDSPIAVQAMYKTTKFETTEFNYVIPGNITAKTNTYGLNIGNYFMPVLLVGIGYTNSKAEIIFPSPFPMMALKQTSYCLCVKYINVLENGTALSLVGNLSSSAYDDGALSLKNTNEYFSVEYFYSRRVSTVIGIGNSSGENLASEGQAYLVGVRYFASPRFSVSARYDRFIKSNAGYMNDMSISVAMALRF